MTNNPYNFEDEDSDEAVAEILLIGVVILLVVLFALWGFNKLALI